MTNSIRIIKDLKSGLAFWTETAPVDGVILDPFQFHRPLIDRSDPKAAATGALEADACGPVFFIGDPFPFMGKGVKNFIG
jgi:hypothetical protein